MTCRFPFLLEIHRIINIHTLSSYSTKKFIFDLKNQTGISQNTLQQCKGFTKYENKIEFYFKFKKRSKLFFSSFTFLCNQWENPHWYYIGQKPSGNCRAASWKLPLVFWMFIFGKEPQAIEVRSPLSHHPNLKLPLLIIKLIQIRSRLLRTDLTSQKGCIGKDKT